MPTVDGGSTAKESLWSLDLFRCESAILRTYWVLVVMDQFTRRIVGFAVHRGVVDGVALCGIAQWIGENLRVENAVIDGEIACVDESGRSVFNDHTGQISCQPHRELGFPGEQRLRFREQ
jgi:hypothetical protein